ncbi:cysteine-rich protein 2-binding protein [Parasteatoda tepidariorum]|uniref:cysteine-rich protein 2-binding protein n=1 Tax=Parasteatoda tepidariorum TaxID=114398 RepID=UPI001C719FB7|nr:cysteine-rich protein 2-binding protein [Parasteatoda tepidariorum]
MESGESAPKVFCYCKSAAEEYMITCTSCHEQFHLTCLKSGRPSSLAGDIYFLLTCERCSPDGQESIKRMKMQWTLVIMLALYNLQLESSGKEGYFRWREHICRYIDKHWSVIFGNERKKSATWHGTVAGALSTGGNRFFTSGFEKLHETGWWSLNKLQMPQIHELDSMALSIKTSRKRRSPELEQLLVEGTRRKKQNVVEAAVALKEKKSIVPESKPSKSKTSDVKCKKKDLSIFPPNHKLKLVVAPPPSLQQSEEKISQNVPKIVIKSEKSSPSSSDFWAKESDADLDMPPVSDTYVVPSAFDVPDSILDSTISEMDVANLPAVKQECESDEDSIPDKTLGTPKKVFPDTSRKRTVVTKEESPVKESAVTESKYKLMSPYEEESLLQKLDNYPVALSKNTELRQLYRKLAVRKLKRERNIPVFDLDVEMRLLRGMDPPDYVKSEPQNKSATVSVSRPTTVFDRYRTNPDYPSNRTQVSFATRLTGKSTEDQENIVSPYSGRILKPFIRRDYKTKPLKLRLLEEIRSRADRGTRAEYPIDYCYVRPEFIPAINALCHTFFWPGIDMSECLQYPDFSCVAVYRKVIIGFAFMVPDAKYNEAYITFIFCHPEWRRSGIGKFMLYHLIQTCMGKDITLHVSATSSALFLYQLFSFKIEELVHDFYDKYLPADSKECRHALFLRLHY